MLDLGTRSGSFRVAADVIQQTRATGLLPTMEEQQCLSPEEHQQMVQAWRMGMADAAEAIRRKEVAEFKARGWPFKWFAEWCPATAAEQLQQDALEEAIDVVDRCYPAIVNRGLNHPEDLGILQTQSFGKSEGIQAKREAYGQLILVSVYAVTGPRNIDQSGTVEFEPGSKSHVFHLLYEALPSVARLAGDLAAFPLITAETNRLTRRIDTWGSEGWLGKEGSRPRLHRPWDTTGDFCRYERH